MPDVRADCYEHSHKKSNNCTAAEKTALKCNKLITHLSISSLYYTQAHGVWSITPNDMINIKFLLGSLPPECRPEGTGDKTGLRIVAQCQENQINLIGNKTMSRTQFAIVVVVTDVIVCAIFVFASIRMITLISNQIKEHRKTAI